MATRVLGGRYTVQDKIGTGGMAIVYRGLDNVLGRTVAIKTMLPQYANDPSFAARFKQEAQAAAALQSPYMVDHVLSPEGATLTTTSPHTIGQPVSSGAAAQVREAMLQVVQSGTGQGAQVWGVDVAGKTGTAQISNDVSNSLFVGFAPYDSPTLAISICIEGDGSDNEGLAAALAGPIIETTLGVQAAGAAS